MPRTSSAKNRIGMLGLVTGKGLLCPSGVVDLLHYRRRSMGCASNNEYYQNREPPSKALIHRLHVVSKAVFGHLSPELGTVSTGMPGMYSAPHARIVGFLADFREGMPMTGHAEDRRIHDVCGYFVGPEEVLQDLCCRSTEGTV